MLAPERHDDTDSPGRPGSGRAAEPASSRPRDGRPWPGRPPACRRRGRRDRVAPAPGSGSQPSAGSTGGPGRPPCSAAAPPVLSGRMVFRWLGVGWF